MDRGRDPFSFPILPLVVMWASYYTCNIIRDVNQWFSKCGWKENLFCDIYFNITYWLKKRIAKFTFLMYSFFWENTFSVNVKKLPSNAIFRWYIFGEFYIIKFNILVKHLVRPNRCFEIFLIDPCAVDIRNITSNYFW